MGIFTRKTDKSEKQSKSQNSKPKAAEEILTPESQNKKEDVVTAAVAKGQAGMSYRILLSPRVSEKAAISTSKDVYVFNVPVSAEKIEIRKAVETLYGVKVEQVRTARGIGKRTARGRTRGQRNNWKKAYVCLKKGQKLDLYEGV